MESSTATNIASTDLQELAHYVEQADTKNAMVLVNKLLAANNQHIFDLTFFKEEQASLLHHAVANSMPVLVNLLILKGAALNATDIHHKKPIDYANEQIKKTIERTQQSTKTTDLHRAAQYGLTLLTQQLINQKADINAPDVRGQKPLYYAITYKQWGIAKILLQQPGLDLKIKKGKTAFDLLFAGNVIPLYDIATLCVNHPSFTQENTHIPHSLLMYINTHYYRLSPNDLKAVQNLIALLISKEYVFPKGFEFIQEQMIPHHTPPSPPAAPSAEPFVPRSNTQPISTLIVNPKKRTLSKETIGMAIALTGGALCTAYYLYANIPHHTLLDHVKQYDYSGAVIFAQNNPEIIKNLSPAEKAHLHTMLNQALGHGLSADETQAVASLIDLLA